MLDEVGSGLKIIKSHKKCNYRPSISLKSERRNEGDESKVKKKKGEDGHK